MFNVQCQSLLEILKLLRALAGEYPKLFFLVANCFDVFRTREETFKSSIYVVSSKKNLFSRCFFSRDSMMISI